MASRMQMPTRKPTRTSPFTTSAVQRLTASQVIAQTDAKSEPVQNAVNVLLEYVVRDSPIQRRKPFDPVSNKDDAWLVNSIKEIGQREPVRLRRVGENEYEIEYGHRRIDALRYLGKREVLAFITEDSEEQALEWTALENTGRPLTASELIETMAAIEAQKPMSIAQMASLLGKSKGYLSELNQVAAAHQSVRFALEQEVLPLRLAIAIKQAPEDAQERLVTLAVGNRGRINQEKMKSLVERAKTGADAVDDLAKVFGLHLPEEAIEDVIANAQGERIDGVEDETSASLNGKGKKVKKVYLDDVLAHLRREMVLSDKRTVREVVAIGLNRKMPIAQIRLASVLAQTGRGDAATAVEIAREIGGDASVKSLLKAFEAIGEARRLSDGKKANRYAPQIARWLTKELGALVTDLTKNTVKE